MEGRRVVKAFSDKTWRLPHRDVIFYSDSENFQRRRSASEYVFIFLYLILHPIETFFSFTQDIMIESEIVAAGSLKGVLSGKHYNRCVRAHKVIYEAMERLRFQAFQKTLSTQEKSETQLIGMDVIEDVEKSVSPRPKF